jgi:membrane protease YdiL (CAAX protease family)
MNDASQATSADWWMLCLAGGISVLVWLWAAQRRRRQLPVLPYQPRHPVPWGASDVLIVFLVYLLLQDGAGRVVRTILPAELIEPLTAEVGCTVHPIVRMVRLGGIGSLLLAAVSVVVVAPVVEEVVFRLLMQGWLETAERQGRKRGVPPPRGANASSREPFRRLMHILLPRGAGPILLTSLVFAAMHLRGPLPVLSHPYLVSLALGSVAANLLALGFLLVLLRFHRGATLVDLGWSREKFLPDIGLGIVGFLAVVGPIYVTQSVVGSMAHGRFCPDPAALLVFALALGTLYFRTHRMVPAIMAHAALNAVTLVMLWVSLR